MAHHAIGRGDAELRPNFADGGAVAAAVNLFADELVDFPLAVGELFQIGHEDGSLNVNPSRAAARASTHRLPAMPTSHPCHAPWRAMPAAFPNGLIIYWCTLLSRAHVHTFTLVHT